MQQKLQQWENHKFNDVYILGAGASLAYGYPIGRDLKLEIYDLFDGKNSIFSDILIKMSSSNDAEIENLYGNFFNDFQSFLEALKKSGAQTIDSFVAKNPRFKSVAQLLIGFLLIMRAKNTLNMIDDRSSSSTKAEPWIYNYLNKRVGTDYEGFLNNPDCFITFNYDLSLEKHFLDYFTTQEISPSIAKIAEKTVYDSLPIFHIYGQLKNLDTIFGSLEKKEPISIHDLMNASENINFIDRKNKDEYEVLRKIISKASRVILLGYGFDPDNNQIIFGGAKYFREKFYNTKIISTSIGLSDSEVQRFKDLSNEIIAFQNSRSSEIEMYAKDCNQLLLEHVLIRKFFHDESP